MNHLMVPSTIIYTLKYQTGTGYQQVNLILSFIQNSKVINEDNIPETDDENPEDYKPETFDNYLNMKIGLPCGPDNDLHHEAVKKRVVNQDNRSI